MSYAYNQNSQKQAAFGAIQSLMNELQTLAPHPDCPQYNGPLFVQNNPHFKASNDHDGMLGSMIMETLLGTAVSEAVSEAFGSWTQSVEGFDAAQALECYSEYISDIEESTQRSAAHGQGTMARLAGKSIASNFNMRSSISPELQAFYNDMPRRMNIERNLSYYAKQIAEIEAQTPTYQQNAPRFAA